MEGTRREEPGPTLIVQELAGTGAVEVPARYVVRQHDRPTVHAATAPIPVIDLGRLSQPDGAEEVVKLRSALESWGLFLVTNHGMEASLMDDMMNASREFFRQPIEEKQRYSNLIDGKHFQHEGYGSEQVRSEDQILDWSDRLYLKVHPEEERNLPLWPENPKSFRDVLHEYTVQCNGVKNRLLPAMAKLLGLNEDYFIRQIGDKAAVHARFVYYPPCPRPDLVFGLKPHSDATVVTVLMVDDDVVGLQVLREGVWYDVPTRPHAFLINLGDAAEILSNGIFKSSVHRVVTNAEKERMSVVMFYSVDFENDFENDFEKEIGPADELIDDKRPALYKKVKIVDYVAGLFEHFSRGTRVIDTVKI